MFLQVCTVKLVNIFAYLVIYDVLHQIQLLITIVLYKMLFFSQDNFKKLNLIIPMIFFVALGKFYFVYKL